MNIVRQDSIGRAELKLVSRPTNTCAGVSNFHFVVASTESLLDAPVVRFFGTDPDVAEDAYNRAVLYAHQISNAL